MAEFPTIPYAGPARSRYGSFNKRYMVVHCTANDAPPANECAYARVRTDGVGLHFTSDPSTVMQALESWYGTGHVGSSVGNSYGISWEFVGFLTSPPAYYRACIDRAAPSMRLVMAKHGIPHRWLTDSQLRAANVKGLVTHLQCSRVLGGSTHTDPGPNFPQQYLIDALNGGADMDPNGRDIHPDLPNSQVFRDLWEALHALNPANGSITRFGYANPYAALLDRQPSVTLTDAQVTALSEVVAERLAPQLEAAAERAVRRVLGGLDGANPAGG